MEKRTSADRHRQRQGAILLLLLLGPAPISLLLVALGDSTVAVAAVLAATAVLVAALLWLYWRQRQEARLALGGGEVAPVLPAGQVAAMLVMVGCIGAATFLLPLGDPLLQRVGLSCVIVVFSIVYGFAGRLRPSLSDPDERCAVLVIGLMATLIAMANACV